MNIIGVTPILKKREAVFIHLNNNTMKNSNEIPYLGAEPSYEDALINSDYNEIY